MKTQMNGIVKFIAVLLVTAGVGLAETTASAAVPSGTISNRAPYAQAPAEKQGLPGTINYVEGQAMLNGEPLSTSAAGYTVAQPGQTIQTQAGYVEVLLTPGAFLRIGHNSEVVMQSLGLTNVQMQVAHGSAMVEVADLVKGSRMQVGIDGATTQIEKRGLYAFDADRQLVRVFDGKAKVLASDNAKSIGKGDQILLSESNLKSHGFDKQVAEADPLYVWSKARSETEAQANVAVANYINVYGGWYGPGWYWAPFWGSYAFLPAYGFAYSPFGWGFYSPGFVYAAPLRYGFYGHGYYHGHVPGVHASVRGYAGGFHGGFAGGFHGAGGHR